MALIDSGQLDTLAEDIVPALPPDPSQEQIAARDAAVDQVKTLATKIFEYMIQYMELKLIKTTLDQSLNTIFSAGVPVPTDGGAALKAAWIAATAAGAKDDATQNNDGTGLIE
jgi:hypothetical protein